MRKLIVRHTNEKRKAEYFATLRLSFRPTPIRCDRQPSGVDISDDAVPATKSCKNDKFKKNLLRKRRTYARYFAKNLVVVDQKLRDWSKLCAAGNPTGLRSRHGGSLNRVLEQVATEKSERKKSREAEIRRQHRRIKSLGVIEGASDLLSEHQKADLRHIANTQPDGVLSRKGAIRKALQHHPECKRMTSGCNCSTGNRKQYAQRGVDPPDPAVLFGKGKKKKAVQKKP